MVMSTRRVAPSLAFKMVGLINNQFTFAGPSIVVVTWTRVLMLVTSNDRETALPAGESRWK